MEVASRSRRRHDVWRVKQRMRRYWRDRGFGRLSVGARQGPTEHWVGNMASTHGKPCSCSLGCGNRRYWDGPSIGERRRGNAPAEILSSDGV